MSWYMGRILEDMMKEREFQRDEMLYNDDVEMGKDE